MKEFGYTCAIPESSPLVVLTLSDNPELLLGKLEEHYELGHDSGPFVLTIVYEGQSLEDPNAIEDRASVHELGEAIAEAKRLLR